MLTDDRLFVQVQILSLGGGNDMTRRLRATAGMRYVDEGVLGCHGELVLGCHTESEGLVSQLLFHRSEDANAEKCAKCATTTAVLTGVSLSLLTSLTLPSSAATGHAILA